MLRLQTLGPGAIRRGGTTAVLALRISNQGAGRTLHSNHIVISTSEEGKLTWPIQLQEEAAICPRGQPSRALHSLKLLHLGHTPSNTAPSQRKHADPVSPVLSGTLR